ncbi:MAG: S9 family peptidase [Oscillospiraceae bacterium]|jgi:acylaminoacyl-peptidase|nr:S9 family peptidase [Oscillospiraceae bacterium]
MTATMRRLELRDFLNYKFLSKLEYSPDGRHAAFVVSSPDIDGNGYKSDIHLLDVRSEKTFQLTSGGDAGSFIWLDGETILFPALRKQSDRDSAARGEKLTVFNKIGIRGGEAAEYFRVPYDVTEIKKIDDKSFALLCSCHPEDPDFTRMDGTERSEAYRRIEENRDYEVLDELPFWSNGDGFTNKKRSRLFIYNPDRGTAEAVTDGLTDVSGMNVRDGKVVYIANRYENKLELTPGVFLYDTATGGTAVELEQDKLRVSFADFFRDGYIISGSDMKEYGLGQYDSFYTLRDGKPEIFCRPDEEIGTCTGSDCRYGEGTSLKVCDGEIYYTTADHTQNALRRITPEGELETVVRMRDTVDGFDIHGGTIIYYGLGAKYLHEIFRLEDGEPRRLTDYNTALLSDIELNQPQPIVTRGSRESVEGFILKPVGFEPGEKYPAALHIHGGPRTAFGDSYFHEAHLWSSRGYFVLFCNPCGSDGRGEEFADIRGKYGTEDFDDLMTFTDGCIEKYPEIDESRLAVTGGSYGGFMTNWIIGHTNRFCCAVSQRGIASWISMFGTTDIGYYFTPDQIAAASWDDHERLWRHSPLKYADRASTPTLFIHSEEDYRCWLAEGLQMFTALKYHGVEARLCMFRGENHELSRSGKPAHRIRRLEEIINWFDRYCKK